MGWKICKSPPNEVIMQDYEEVKQYEDAMRELKSVLYTYVGNSEHPPKTDEHRQITVRTDTLPTSLREKL